MHRQNAPANEALNRASLRFAGGGSAACNGCGGTEKSSGMPKAFRNAHRALDLIGDKVGIGRISGCAQGMRQ